MSGCGASTRASAARRASPPDSGRVLLAAEAELLQQIARLVGVVARAQPGFDIGQRRRIAGEVRLLRQVADAGARLHEALAAIGLDQPGGDLQQRRLARAVAADEAHALARRHRQLDAVEQRRAAEGERDVAELEEGRRHGGFRPSARLSPPRR